MGGYCTVAQIAAGLPTDGGGLAATLLATGLAALFLGLGFTHAVTMLRAVVQAAMQDPARVAPQAARHRPDPNDEGG